MVQDPLLRVLGYLLVALGAGLESLGVPVPGEAILLLAGAAAATGLGRLDGVVLAAVIGATVGDGVAYLLGRHFGRERVDRLRFYRDAAALARGEAALARLGPASFIVGRFLPEARLAAAHLAGVRHAGLARFLAAALLSATLWAAALAGLGFAVGDNLALVEPVVGRVGGLWAALLLVGGLLLWLNASWVRGQGQFVAGRIGTAWAWWRAGWRRLAQEGRRGLVLYLIVLLIGGWAVGILVDDWVQREPELYQRDQLATVWLQKGAGEFSPGIDALAWLGDPRFLAVASVLTAIWLWRRGRRRRAGLTLLNYAGALLLGGSLQLALRRPLPPPAGDFWHLTAFAFPHLPSLLATSTFGWLAYVILPGDEPWSRRVNGATVGLFGVVGVGLAGLYLGQARLSDVLAGLSLGVLWLGVPLASASTEVAEVRQQVRAQAEALTPRQRMELLLALALPVLVVTFVQPPIAQDPSYHHFADTRTMVGVPNFLNVVSNVPFLFVGALGLYALRKWRRQDGWPAFAAAIEERPYLVMFFAVAVTSFGSAYYHLAPNNTHLVWDRLPMSFGFMALFAAVIMERVDRRIGLRLLYPLVVLGIGSVVYWYVSELHLRGDLRLYADVQYYPMLAIPLIAALFRSRYSLAHEVYTVILIYGAAKAMELLDWPAYRLLGGVVSGHTLKHILAAVAILWILRMLWRRQPLAETAGAASAARPASREGQL